MLKKIIEIILLVIIVNVLSNYIHLGIDLTEDKTHSLSNKSKEIIKNIDDKLYIKVYLEGDFPADFKHLQQATYNMLKRFKKTNNLLDFEFINPNTSNSEENKQVFNQLIKLGLAPTDLQVRNSNSTSSQIIFPGALIYYKNESIPVNFLKNQITNTPAENINYSIENLEYEFISAILRVSKSKNDKIAFIQGHGELKDNNLYDLINSVLNDNFKLSYYFNVERFNIKEFEIDSTTMSPDVAKQIYKLCQYKAIVIAKPILPFNNLDKLIIDQYIMNGGKVLWLIDGVHASMDSLKNNKRSFITVKNSLNIDDQLFKYGVRINADLIEDLRCIEIPIITGYSNSLPQQTFFSWPFSPLLTSNNNHPISKGIDAVKSDFVSSIDTIQNNLKKTILLSSSMHSRLIMSPAKIGLSLLENPPSVNTYNKKYIPTAILLEGKFESVFKNRILSKNHNINIKNESSENKMIVISDGDIISNDVSEKGNIYPLGYDKYINYTYAGNKFFVMNAIQYLCDNNSISLLKGKSLKLRMLNKTKIQDNKLLIQLINILTPIILTFIFFFYFNYLQKRTYR